MAKASYVVELSDEAKKLLSELEKFNNNIEQYNESIRQGLISGLCVRGKLEMEGSKLIELVSVDKHSKIAG